MAKLVVSLNGRIVGNFFLDQPSFSIGANDDNDLCLDAPGREPQPCAGSSPSATTTSSRT